MKPNHDPKGIKIVLVSGRFRTEEDAEDWAKAQKKPRGHFNGSLIMYSCSHGVGRVHYIAEMFSAFNERHKLAEKLDGQADWNEEDGTKKFIRHAYEKNLKRML